MALAWTTLVLCGCRQYEVQGSRLRAPAPRDPNAAAARLRLRPGLRAGMSETSQDVEHSLGY